jgi:hypothetical protein
MASIRATNFYGLGEQPLIQYSGPVKKRKPKKATLEEFANLYKHVPSDKIIGEGSSFFNFTARAAQRIHYYNPESKLIFVLRHPSDRAFSQYLYARKCGWEPCSSFKKALAEEPMRKKEGWFPFLLYKESSLYAEKLSVYYQLFGLDQIYVCTFDDFIHTTSQIMGDLYTFVGVDANFKPEVSTNHNPSRLQPFAWTRSPFNDLSYKLLRRVPSYIKTPTLRIIDNFCTQTPKINNSIRSELTHYYHQDILFTQTLTGKDLSSWLL